jgi:CubicO group peptidase (beta-lactamase class C family)
LKLWLLLSALAGVLGGAPVAAKTPGDRSANPDVELHLGDAVFTAPAQWKVRSTATEAVLAAPDGGLSVAIIDAGVASDAKQALASAWTTYAPAAHPGPGRDIERSPHDGWDEAWSFAYSAAPGDAHRMSASALRAGRRWVVMIVDGTPAARQKREGDILLLFQSLHPDGYTPVSFAGRRPVHLDAARVAALRDFVASAMHGLGIPGVGLALVEGGKVAYAGGLGVRKLGAPETVDADTLFMIGSTTKPLTSLMLAELVAKGKLSWDEPVTTAYPGFQLGDADLTRRVRIRDLLCACTGIPRQDYEYVFNSGAETPASTVFERLSQAQPTTKFGEAFQYSSDMVAAAGYVGGHVAFPRMEIGAAYDRAMREFVFTPLGMNRTTFDLAKAVTEDHASPHGRALDGEVRTVPESINMLTMSIRPAGAAWSSAADMARYLQFEIAAGQPGMDRELARAVVERWVPGVSAGVDAHYGLGIGVRTVKGVRVLSHDGATAGFTAHFFVLPDIGVGAVLLTNSEDGDAMMGPFLDRLLEVLYDQKAPQSVSELAFTERALARDFQEKQNAIQTPGDARLISDLRPEYLNPALGHIAVSRDARGVVFDFGTWSSHMGVRTNPDNSISLVTTDAAVAGDWSFEFRPSPAGGELIARDGQHKYEYRPSPD